MTSRSTSPTPSSPGAVRVPRRAAPPSAEMLSRIHHLADYISRHADEVLPLARLAREVALSPSHLQRSFTQVLGVSPKAYQAAQRLAQFKRGLREGRPVLDATFSAGYGSTSRIYEQVTGGLGMTPSAYRRGGAGEVITYAVRETAFGHLLMAATARGVCLVEFGEDPAMLKARLTEEYPNAVLEAASSPAREPLDAWMTALDAHLTAEGPLPEVPLDLRGTAFQIKVWRFLLRVKPGEVVSYSDLAAGIGHPRAVRAVGSACGANRIAVLVPCHRALRGDGSLGGYRWGLERKRRLLDREHGARS